MRFALVALLFISMFGIGSVSFADDLPQGTSQQDMSQDLPQNLPQIEIDLREADGIEVAAGIVVSVINMQEISTETCPVGFKTKFVTTNDLYIDDTNVIPENSAFFGYIEKINEPIIGTNASMKVKITKLVFPDNYEMPVRGYLYTKNDNLIGGEMTPPAEWVKVPHYQAKLQGISWIHRGATLQLRPGAKRSMGVHTKVPAGEQNLIILTAPTVFTHIYTMH